jgi:hypothetical protein
VANNHNLGKAAVNALELTSMLEGRKVNAPSHLYKLTGDAMREKRKTKQIEPNAERKAILDERETLKRLFPAAYSPDIGVFTDGKVEVMFKLTISQAQALANLLREHRL